MYLRKRFIQSLLICILFLVLSYSYSRYTIEDDEPIQDFDELIRISKEKSKSDVRFENEIERKEFCKYRSANFAIYDFDQSLYPYIHCIPMHTFNGIVPICVQEHFNKHIIQHIKMSRNKASVLEDFEQVLVNNPGYDVIDIGAKIGMYSLLSANQKRLVLAVEPMYINAKIFHQTVILNRMETLVTLVAGRPLSDNYRRMNLLAISNDSASWIKYSTNNVKPQYHNDVVETQLSDTLMLDDLLNALTFRRAIMLLNVDGNEASVVKGGQKFFECLEIPYVFMEWSSSFMNDKLFLFDFFSRRSYTPYVYASDTEVLTLNIFDDWPLNIVWKKNRIG